MSKQAYPEELEVHFNGDCACKTDPMSPRAQADQRLLVLLKHHLHPAPMRAGRIWPWWSICSRVRWSAGPWVAASISGRRGDCHDNAVAESFFPLLKRERIRRQIDSTRDAAKADVFNCIETFYNPKRRHGTAGDTSPAEFERRHSQRLESAQGIRGDSDLIDRDGGVLNGRCRPGWKIAKM